MIPVFIVRRPVKHTAEDYPVMEPVSAWVDEYDAKYEAARWSENYKEDWDYVPGTLTEVADGANA